MSYIGFYCTLVIVGRFGYIHSQDELAIDFIMQRTDNSTYQVPEVTVDSDSLERLQIMCRTNNIPTILVLNRVNFHRLKNGYLEILATMQSRFIGLVGYQKPELMLSSAASMQAVGVFSKTNLSIGISIPVASLTCNDGLMYYCDLSYDVSSDITKDSSVAKNLTVSVQPMNMELRAFNQSSSFSMTEIIGSGIDSTTMASFTVGQVVKLTCKASLGTCSNGLIYWRKSNIVAGSGMASYIPNQGQHEEGQVTPNGCQFEKTDSILYNTTEQDTIRSASNPLQFQCYISVPSSSYVLPEATVKDFYIKVYNVNGAPETEGLSTAEKQTVNAPLLARVVVGTLATVTAFVTAVLLIRKYRIRCLCEERAVGNNSTQQRPVTLNANEETNYSELDSSKGEMAADCYDTLHLLDVQGRRQ